MAILFGFLGISPLQFHVYPPYGLIIEAFILLGSYFLFAVLANIQDIDQDTLISYFFIRLYFIGDYHFVITLIWL
jgi:hypothetical protein